MRKAKQDDGMRNLTHFSPLLDLFSFLAFCSRKYLRDFFLSSFCWVSKVYWFENTKNPPKRKLSCHYWWVNVLLITSIDKFLRYRIDNRVTRNATLESTSGFFPQIDFMSTAFVYDSNKCQKLIFHSRKSPYKASNFKIAKSCFRGFILTRRRWLVRNMES